MIGHRILKLEDEFDSGETSTQKADTDPLAELTGLMSRENWSEVYSRARILFENESGAEERAFIIQWAVAAAETQYDTKERKNWLQKWNRIPNWSSHSYCHYLRIFHDGLSAFFDSNLMDAEFRFKKAYDIAVSANYIRGQTRSLFHLGLVCRDRGMQKMAMGYFDKSAALAESSGALRMLRRVQAQIERLKAADHPPHETSHQASQEIYFDKFHNLVLELLEGRQFAEARATLIQAETARRARSLLRKSESFFSLLPLIHLGHGKTEAAKRCLNLICDPILKIRTLKIKKNLFGIGEPERKELSALEELHGLSLVLLKTSNHDERAVEIGGVDLSKFRKDIRSLIELLVKSEGAVTKELVCIRLWNLKYEPTIHDKKVYKLIHETKGALAFKDLILNTYGGYRLNPKYLGRN